MLLIETVCGGHGASGGGCGGPLGVRRVTQAQFDACTGDNVGTPVEHRDDEHDFDLNEVEGCKLVFRPCSGCYQRC